MRLRACCAALLMGWLLIPRIAQAEAFALDAGVGIQGIKLAGDGIGDVYSFGVGVGAEFGITVSNLYRLAFSLNPTYGFGTPDSRPLASEPSGSLWSIPILATLQIPFLKKTPYIPYAGLGAGLHYVRESVSFTSGLGAKSQTESVTEFGWHVMAGVEQNRPTRLFGEVWFTRSSSGGIDGVIDGRNLGGLQLRIGYRRDL